MPETPKLGRRLLLWLGLGAGLIVAAVAVSHLGDRDAPSARLEIVATTGMIADAVRQIGGEHVDVTGLMGPGVDPHTYRQTRSDIAAMTGADAVFWHGLHLEAQLMEFLEELGAHQPVIALAERLPADLLIDNAGFAGRFDPHVWMDPLLWREVVLVARDELAGLVPGLAEEFGRNAERYLAEIDELAGYAARILDSVPPETRVLVTAHDAFGYFGRAHDFEVRGIQGISTESEAGLREIEDLVGFLVERRIGAIFVESSVSERNVRALIEGAAARGHTVVIGGQLFSDAMGAPGTYEGTYVGMIDHNATVIARALGGEAPTGGLSDRLARAD